MSLSHPRDLTLAGPWQTHGQQQHVLHSMHQRVLDFLKAIQSNVYLDHKTIETSFCERPAQAQRSLPWLRREKLSKAIFVSQTSWFIFSPSVFFTVGLFCVSTALQQTLCCTAEKGGKTVPSASTACKLQLAITCY